MRVEGCHHSSGESNADRCILELPIGYKREGRMFTASSVVGLVAKICSKICMRLVPETVAITSGVPLPLWLKVGRRNTLFIELCEWVSRKS